MFLQISYFDQELIIVAYERAVERRQRMSTTHHNDGVRISNKDDE